MTQANTTGGPKRRWPLVVAVAILIVVACVAVGELLGWPFLATPAEHFLSEKLERRVRFSDANATAATGERAFRVRFLGGVRVHAPYLEISAPAWSQAPHLVLAHDVSLDLRYIDLWRAQHDQQLRIERLHAIDLNGNLERLADGRASWQFGRQSTQTATQTQPPLFGSLQVANGTVHYRDAPRNIEVDVRLSLVDGTTVVESRPTSATGAATAPNAPGPSAQPASSLQANAVGRYRGLPLKIDLVSSGALPWVADGASAQAVPLTLNATVGSAVLAFKGTALDAMHLDGFTGHFSLKGPSLAAVGDPLGVTLPTTAAFRTNGVIVRRGDIWNVVIDEATVGASQLTGAFIYATDRTVPLLTGRLGGRRLLLADLGPAVGVTPTPTTKSKGMVLPDRPFDLPAMRAMDANVLLDFNELDLGTSLLEPLRPMHGHLQLSDGVLTVRDLDARTGPGQLKGDLRLDGRQSTAVWNANLQWDGVRLERWIHQARKSGNAPPFVSGRLSGSTTLQGHGRSTAQILATLKGGFRTELREGTISHLVVEAAGLDIAQGLGMLLKGDDALPVQCAVADLRAEEGVFRPRVMVIDTTDSTIWVDGSLSLAAESINLRAVVSPKDFSPLTLRTPLLVRGSLGKPVVSVEKGPLGRKLATALLLALVNPVAALIPLIDRGETDVSPNGAAGCKALTARSNAQRGTAARVP